MKKVFWILIKIFGVLGALVILMVIAIIMTEKKAVQRAEALRSKITVGLNWSQVAELLKEEKRWHMVGFRGEGSGCGYISRDLFEGKSRDIYQLSFGNENGEVTATKPVRSWD